MHKFMKVWGAMLQAQLLNVEVEKGSEDRAALVLLADKTLAIVNPSKGKAQFCHGLKSQSQSVSDMSMCSVKHREA